jgi:hypothetical protein
MWAALKSFGASEVSFLRRVENLFGSAFKGALRVRFENAAIYFMYFPREFALLQSHSHLCKVIGGVVVTRDLKIQKASTCRKAMRKQAF